MQVFSATLNQMFVLFTFMALGYFLNYKSILPLNTSIAVSRLETNVLVPCLVFNTFYKYCTVKNMSEKWLYIVYGLAITVVSIIIGVLLSKLFAKDSYLQKIYTYSFAVANFSFMGNAVVLGIFGEDILFDYMIFTLPLCLYVYSFGTASLIPKKENQKNKFSLKVFLNPICISMLLGGVAGITGLPIPKFLITAVSSAGACMSPLAMILTGFIVANFSLKKLLRVKRIYLASILRLIILPLIFVLVLKLIGTDDSIVMLTLCATAMPLGLNTVVFPAAYEGDTTPGASMALISHVMSIITIPVMFAIFI
ncbi:MAG: AEC family transporter [Clostridia bacterium]|nr:AEC family transporter [Clostridia bacterium]